MFNFDELCQIEPELAVLFKSVPARILAPAPHAADPFWMNWSGIKADMTRLVGWYAEDRRIGQHWDYETAYHALFDEANTHCPEVDEDDDEA